MLEVTAALAKIHMDEAWKELWLVEQEEEDYVDIFSGNPSSKYRRRRNRSKRK